MKIKPDKINAIVEEIDHLLAGISKAEVEHDHQIQAVHTSFEKSAKNLIQYRALRSIDITSLQRNLGDLGLSRVARAEPHILASLQNCRYILKALLDDKSLEQENANISIKKARKVLRTHTKDLLGYRSKGRRVRIMVTLPSEAAYNYELVEGLLHSGMNTVRINCAHDGPSEWQKMIDNVVIAKEKLKKNCRISMDLAGPKIRTGAIEPGPHVRRFKPERNELGQIIEPAKILLVTTLSEGANNELPVDGDWLKDIEIGNKVRFVDARKKKRTFLIKGIEGDSVIANCLQTCYVQTGTVLIIKEADHSCEVKELPPLEQALSLKIGDTLRIIKEQISTSNHYPQGIILHACQ